MCISKERWDSILTPRLVTVVERGIFWPEKVMLVMGDEVVYILFIFSPVVFVVENFNLIFVL